MTDCCLIKLNKTWSYIIIRHNNDDTWRSCHSFLNVFKALRTFFQKKKRTVRRSCSLCEIFFPAEEQIIMECKLRTKGHFFQASEWMAKIFLKVCKVLLCLSIYLFLSFSCLQVAMLCTHYYAILENKSTVMWKLQKFFCHSDFVWNQNWQV